MLRDLADGLLAVVFPSACLLCDQELAQASWTGVCGACWSSLEAWNGPACERCGIPLTSDQASGAARGASTSAAPDVLCHECEAGEYDFDLARSYGLYGGRLRAAILQLKFHRYERLGRRLGKFLAPLWSSVADDVIAEAGELPLIVPVPLHSSRRRERGFNQAELLAQGLARALAHDANAAARSGRAAELRRLRVETRGLRRVRATTPQTGLSLPVRQSNVRGAFVVESVERFRERTVVLVDDVMTTGATASACAAALKNAGVRHVVVLTMARATPQFPDFGSSPADDVPVDDHGQDSQ